MWKNVFNNAWKATKFVGQYTMIGVNTSIQQGLQSKNKDMVKRANGQVNEAYDYYAKPKIESGMRLIKGNKNQP